MIRSLSRCRNRFILFVSRASLCPSFSFARFDGHTSTYKSSYARSSTFQRLDELDTSWRWTTSPLLSSICGKKIGINTNMDEFSHKTMLFICYSSTRWREWASILNPTCAEAPIVDYYTRWVEWSSKALLTKKAIGHRAYAASKQSISSYSRMKKKRRRLMCESQGTQKAFHKRHTKGYSLV